RAGVGPWEQLEKLGAGQELLDGKLANVARRRGRLAEDVERALAVALEAPAADAPKGANGFQDRVLAWRRERDRELERLGGGADRLRGRQEEAARERGRLRQELEAAGPLVEARRAGRWWTGAWWRALFRGGLLARHDEQSARLGALGPEEQELAAEAERL